MTPEGRTECREEAWGPARRPLWSPRPRWERGETGEVLQQSSEPTQTGEPLMRGGTGSTLDTLGSTFLLHPQGTVLGQLDEPAGPRLLGPATTTSRVQMTNVLCGGPSSPRVPLSTLLQQLDGDHLLPGSPVDRSTEPDPSMLGYHLGSSQSHPRTPDSPVPQA